jgi:starch synthase (maltosyl-transferring)
MEHGKRRVIIENVQPRVDGGLYPAKRSVGERVDVTAAIYGDGHDHIRAEVLYKKEGAKAWSVIELQQTFNDDWQASFYVPEKGTYLFTIQAWIDHFDTWYDGFKKKANAKVEVKVELMEGAVLLRTLGETNKELISLARKLEDTAKYQTAIDTVLSTEFANVVHENPLRENETKLGYEVSVQVEHTKANYSAWYEFFPRSASLESGKHGTFADCIRLLPRISAMGFDVLYFPPIHPIGKVNRKGKNNNVKSKPGEPGSPWAIGSDEGGHKSILPALGTMDDFKKLIGEAKKLDIDIAMDIAFQCAPDHPYVTEHPEWFKQRPDGSIQYAENPPKKYQDIYPFNFETDNWKELWEELKSVFLFWMEQGITIFRIDNPHTKPIPFWHWVIAEVQKVNPDVIFSVGGVYPAQDYGFARQSWVYTILYLLHLAGFQTRTDRVCERIWCMAPREITSGQTFGQTLQTFFRIIYKIKMKIVLFFGMHWQLPCPAIMGYMVLPTNFMKTFQ